MLLAAVAMICTSAVMTSCGSDDDDTIDNSSIYGRWTNVKDDYLITQTRWMDFEKDGTFVLTLVTKDITENTSTTEELGSGTYSYNVTKNILTLKMVKSSKLAAGTETSTVGTIPVKNFFYKGYTFQKAN